MNKLLKFFSIICGEFIEENLIGIVLFSTCILSGMVLAIILRNDPDCSGFYAFGTGFAGFLLFEMVTAFFILVYVEEIRPIIKYFKNIWDSI